MRRPLPLRALMVATGLALFAFYAAVAYLFYRGALYLWARRPDPETTAVVVVVTALAFGYASYRVGTARILQQLDATELPRRRAPELYRAVEDLAARMDLDPPTVHVARMGVPNALAIGRPRDGHVVVDGSLFRLLSGRELLAILAHELAHVESRDGLVQTLGFSLVRTVAGVVMLVVLPLAVVAGGFTRAFAYVAGGSPREVAESVARARLAVGQAVILVLVLFTVLLRAHSRRRELAADDRAAELTDPAALARALAKIHRAAESGWDPLAPLYVSGDDEGLFTRLLATHPDVEERVARLRERAGGRRVEISHE